MFQRPQDILLISTEQPEIRVAHVRNGRLFDLFIERDGRLLNSIFKGRVANVVAGMDAAFIDIGLQRNALIYAGDIVHGALSKANSPSINNLVKVGDELIVQVARPPVGNKGARVTTRLSLTGRYAVLSANDDKVGVSQRIENSDDRNRLRRVAEKIRPLDHGLILRTEAAGTPENALINDVNEIALLIRKIREDAVSAAAPALLHREPGVLGRIVRDRINEAIESIWVDTIQEFELLQGLMSQTAPELLERVHLYNPEDSQSKPLFENFGIAQDIEAVQNHSIPLPHGGTLAIDETEALCAIDVNTGKFIGKSRLSETVLQTNLEAVEAAARQIRLRNLSGVVVIDFIDMERQKDRVAVLDALEAALKQDRNRTRIVQLSPSGLVEITRRRESPSLRQLLKRPCPYCQGGGVIKSQATIAVEARKRVRYWAKQNLPQMPEAHANPTETGSRPIQTISPQILVTLHPEPACAFLGPANEYVFGLEKTMGARIWLQVETNFHQESITVESFDPAQIPASPRQPLQLGAVISVPTQIARFPQKDPLFIAWNKRLVLLENIRQLQNHQSKTFKVSITKVERWYVTGNIVSDQ
jgi:ribonuclease G